MFGNYLKTAFRNLKRQKLYTAINVFGLAVGVAGCVLAMLYVRHEASYDEFHHDKDRIFRILQTRKIPDMEEFTAGFQPLPLGPALHSEFPEVEAFTRSLKTSGTVRHREMVDAEEFLFVDPAFLRMFTFPLVHGDSRDVLNAPNAIVLSSSAAKKYFGDSDPLGRVLHLTFRRSEDDFVVRGVTATIPDNSSLEFDVLLPIIRYPAYKRKIAQWTVSNGSLFVMLRKPVNAPALGEKLAPFVEKYYAEIIKRSRERGRLSEDPDALRLTLQGLLDIHLDKSVQISPEKISNPLYGSILAGIAALILLVACVNFINLAVARSGTRAREVGMRKVLGAGRLQLMQQFFGETLILCFLAFAGGLGLARLALPAFNHLAEKSLDLRLFPDISLILLFSGLILVVGILAGSYPAFYISRFQPIAALRGKLKVSRRKLMGGGLVIFQFGLSIFLIICALFMKSQHNHLMTQSLGYIPEQVVVIPTFDAQGEGRARVERLRERLRNHTGIVNVAATNNPFTHGWDLNGFSHEGVQRRMYVYLGDFEYMTTLGIELERGRNFDPKMGTDPEEAVIVNQALIKEFEWKEPVLGRRLSGWNEQDAPGGPKVIGVMKDYNFLSLKHEIEPAILIMDPEFAASYALVRIETRDVPASLELLRETWKEVAPNTPFQYTFLEDDLQAQYRNEMRWERIMGFASLVAVVLACLGIYGLAVHALIRRTKEIGIRKVLGASVGRITRLLTKDFVTQVLLANIIAWPAAWLIMDKWLGNFAYRVRMNPAVFAAAGAAALLISLITVGTQAVKAALTDPVETLRCE